jgi:HAD superfamily hydrolase (TIGR01662 family)
MRRGVLFDVDFTLIRPGPTFQSGGYQAFCARHGMKVDPSAFDRAVASAAHLLDGADDALYDEEIFIGYARHVIEHMGACGDSLHACAREIYDAWAANHHFELYEDVPSALRGLVAAGIRVGLVSNSHRCLKSFQSHFELRELVFGAVSSFEHGHMKPHPSIFRAALQVIDIESSQAVMVGDSVRHDIEGALSVGMRAIFLNRAGRPHEREQELARLGVPTIRSLSELTSVLPRPWWDGDQGVQPGGQAM